MHYLTEIYYNDLKKLIKKEVQGHHINKYFVTLGSQEKALNRSYNLED
jgi:hypothetical protein